MLPHYIQKADGSYSDVASEEQAFTTVSGKINRQEGGQYK